MESIFSESIEVSGSMSARIKAIFDPGSRVKRTIRGTEILDTRPFIISEKDLRQGDVVTRAGQKFRVAEIQRSAVGFSTYFLEEDDDRSSDYLS